MVAAIPKFTARVTKLLKTPAINKPANDYKAYLRPGPTGGKGLLVGMQYMLTKAEAKALATAVNKTYTVATQGKIVKELFARSESRVAMGTIKLTPDGATQLTNLAKLLKLDLKFNSNQLPPIHPVG